MIDEIMELLSGRKEVIVIYNKTDLEPAVDIEELKEKTGSPVIPVSVVEETGISQNWKMRSRRCFFMESFPLMMRYILQMHDIRPHLKNAKESLKLVMDSIAMGYA